MEVQVEILIQTITAQYGTLNPGDTLRTNAAFAAHLVEDCRAAKYRKEQAVPQPVAPVEVLVPALAFGAESDVQTSAQAVQPSNVDEQVATLINPNPEPASLIVTASESVPEGVVDVTTNAGVGAAESVDVQTSAQPEDPASPSEVASSGNGKRKRSATADKEG